MNGYSGTILHCNLSTSTTVTIPTSRYAEDYLGGRGLAARLYWDFAEFNKGAFEPETPFVIATGPLAGFPGLAGSRWTVCSKSPAIDPEIFSYNSMGGSFGVRLKSAGIDAVVITGMAPEPSWIFIHDSICEIRSAERIWGQGAARARDSLKNELGKDTCVLATGPAGENRVVFASLLADEDASGAAGLGAVMGSKNLKAVATAGNRSPLAAHPDRLKTCTDFLRKRTKEELVIVTPEPVEGLKTRRRACVGCIAGCNRYERQLESGQRGKYQCSSGFFYESAARSHYGEPNPVPFMANRLCDDYGLDINVIIVIMEWLDRCHSAGILSDRETGIPLSQYGSWEYIETLVKIIALRRGIGEALARGPVKAAQCIGRGTPEMIGDSFGREGAAIFYPGRVYVTNALLTALEPRQPTAMINEIGGTVTRWLGTKQPAISSGNLDFIARHFWGGPAAADFTTYEGKGLCTKMVQDRHAIKESAILCYFSWHLCAVEMYRPTIVAEILSAVTGIPHEAASLYLLGERISNLQRAITVMERKSAREEDILPDYYFDTPVTTRYMNPDNRVPGPGLTHHSRQGAVLDRKRFEWMKEDYYQERGWDKATGLQEKEKLNALGLDDVCDVLLKNGLVVT